MYSYCYSKPTSTRFNCETNARQPARPSELDECVYDVGFCVYTVHTHTLFENFCFNCFSLSSISIVSQKLCCILRCTEIFSFRHAPFCLAHYTHSRTHVKARATVIGRIMFSATGSLIGLVTHVIRVLITI